MLMFHSYEKQVGYEVQNESIGYLIDRAKILNTCMLQRLSRVKVSWYVWIICIVWVMVREC